MTEIIYSKVYDSLKLRGSEEIRPWDIQEVLRRFWKPGVSVLDVGCGTCAKTVWMAPLSKEFIALDPSEKMRRAAQARLRLTDGRSRVIAGTAEAIPLPSASVSFLICILSPHNISEFARVLTAGSFCILEKIGENDKRALKEVCSPDAAGARGQFAEFTYPNRQLQIKKQLSEYFDIILFCEGWWKSHLTRSQLVLLLEQTNTVRDFSIDKDQKALDAFEALQKAQKNIALQHHRYLFVAYRR